MPGLGYYSFKKHDEQRATDGTMAMTTLRATSRTARTRVFPLAPWCLLVFALVVLHLALMTGEHHSDTAEAPHARGMVVNAVAASAAMLAAHEHDGHDTPRNTLDGCPAGQAILPLLPPIGFVGLVFARTPASAMASSAVARRPPPCVPPPLPAAQRRALLQIFII